MRANEFIKEGRTEYKGYFGKDGKRYDTKEECDEANIPDLEVGDEIKVGKYRNVKTDIKDFKTDDNGQPVVKTGKGDRKAYGFKVSKLEEVAADPLSATFANKKREQSKLNRQFKLAQARIEKSARAGKQPSPKDMAFVYGGTEEEWVISQNRKKG